MIERKRYLDKLIRKKENGMIKVITGIRRCGKSYLLFEIYHQYLHSIGVDDSHIIELALDDDLNIRYRNPLELGKFIREQIRDSDRMYYIFLDEIQKVASIPNPYLPDSDEKIGFVDVVLGLMKIKNADIYVTGSNSRMLSTDILTEFRGRGDEIRVNPLSFAEFHDAYPGDPRDACNLLFPVRHPRLPVYPNGSANTLANLSGVCPSTVYSMLNQKSQNPGVVSIKKLCDGLNISLREFFDTELFDDLEQEIQ